MKLAYLSGSYPQFAENAYRDHPGLDRQPYLAQRAVLERQGFAWTGAWPITMGALGWEVMDITYSVAQAQKRWAEENGFPVPVDWVRGIPFEQIRRFQPEVLLFSDPRTFDAIWLKELRAACSQLRLIIAFSSTASYDLETLRASDMVLSCSKYYVGEFRRLGLDTAFLRHAFNSGVLASLTGALPAPAPNPAVVFCGNIFRAENYHTRRDQLLESLVARVPLHIHTPQSEISRWSGFGQTWGRRGAYLAVEVLRATGFSNDRIRSLPFIGRANQWKSWPTSVINPQLRTHMRPGLFGLEMFKAFGAHAITLNIHIDVAMGEAANMRLFEATGTGSCLLTDGRGDIDEIFHDGTEVVTYASPEECAERAQWLLAHPRECREIGLAGQRRAMRDHTYHNRAHELHEIIRERLS